jgi:pyrimidine deaminase RibD-like protein
VDTELQTKYMNIALQESKRAFPRCLPNPPVGCVLVKDDTIVSRGFTQEPGAHHAEADALIKYTGSLKYISAFVTLEPCSFFGRTPSCAQALIDRNITKVFVAMTDPDPRNSGRGIAMLRAADIEVIEGVLLQQVSEFLSPFLNRAAS